MLTKIKKIFQYVFNPEFRLSIKIRHNVYDSMDDLEYLRMIYKVKLKRELHIESPKTFDEKLQWLKLYYRKSSFTTMVDKYSVKKYVADKIGKEYIIPTLAIWNNWADIDFSLLPNQFVLKCTHDSGGVIICKDKNSFDKDDARKKIESSLRRNFYYPGREWPYKNVQPRIIAEPYMKEADSSELHDYKFYCFNGIPMYCQVISNRTTNETIDFFNMEWEHQEFTGLALPVKPFSASPIPIPVCFDEMKRLATVLSQGIPFLRVDFYEVNEKVYFGELTFYPASGFGSFTPNQYNTVLGDLLVLPTDMIL